MNVALVTKPAVLQLTDIAAAKQFESNVYGAFGPSVMISQQLIVAFAELTGDKNPLHLDVSAAANGPFGKRVAHGALITSLYPRMMPPSLFAFERSHVVNRGFTAKFNKPVFAGHTIAVRHRIERVTGSSAARIVYVDFRFEIMNLTAQNQAANGTLTLLYMAASH